MGAPHAQVGLLLGKRVGAEVLDKGHQQNAQEEQGEQRPEKLFGGMPEVHEEDVPHPHQGGYQGGAGGGKQDGAQARDHQAQAEFGLLPAGIPVFQMEDGQINQPQPGEQAQRDGLPDQPPEEARTLIISLVL